MTEVKTRPWQAVSIRVAQNEHGLAIRDLLVANGIMEALAHGRWDDIFPFWLLAMNGDEIVGCIQMVAAKPYGFLEFMAVKPGVSTGVRAVTVKKLLHAGCQQLRELGSDFAVGTVPTTLKSYKNVLKRNGCLIGLQCNLTYKRLFVGERFWGTQ
jgi:hypothetical protein